MHTNIKKILLKNKNNILSVKLNKDSSDEMLDKIALKLANGTKIILIDISKTTSKFALEFCNKTKQLCSLYEALFLIYDRIDIIELTEADGIILNKNSFDIKYAKRLLSKDKIFGFDISDNNFLDYAMQNTPDMVIINSNNKQALKSLSVALDDTKYFIKEKQLEELL